MQVKNEFVPHSAGVVEGDVLSKPVLCDPSLFRSCKCKHMSQTIIKNLKGGE